MADPTNVHLMQLLCPRRHCVMVGAWDPKQGSTGREIIAAMEAAGPPERCDICGSTLLQYEGGTSPWATMEEAEPAIMVIAAQIRATRDLVVSLREAAQEPPKE